MTMSYTCELKNSRIYSFHNDNILISKAHFPFLYKNEESKTQYTYVI